MAMEVEAERHNTFLFLCLFQLLLKMSTVHEILSKLTLEGDQALPPSAYATVKPYGNFDANRDAAALETAIKTKGVDEVTIVNILTNRSNEQRQDIAFAYQRRTKKELPAALKSALSGHLETVILGLLKTPAQYDASELKAAMKASGCNYLPGAAASLLGFMVFKTDLEKDIASDTSGDFRKLMIQLAKVRASSGLSGWWVFFLLVSCCTLPSRESRFASQQGSVVGLGKVHLHRVIGNPVIRLGRVFERYKTYSPYDMQESIKKEVKGDLENAFLNLVQCIQNKQLYFADRLYDSMKVEYLKAIWAMKMPGRSPACVPWDVWELLNFPEPHNLTCFLLVPVTK
ncbi:hypothetical protein JRQ81_006903 [Phrynocephalus forsythii]|uniref:Annexin n=1 Tax=Phrynocephalus forsythii TaxID=171643 RepID=A0A9Q0XE06_9SAUR|nr:hypothetical protein JRQ81_006903 [Phrynocephalus forsythii]